MGSSAAPQQKQHSGQKRHQHSRQDHATTIHAPLQ
jgi:hypothetical protein